MKQYVISIFVLLCLVSCTQHSEHWETLNDMETVMSERPDSALEVLRDINRDELSSDEERAKHALLLSMALDKNYIDETDISLISEAKEYYADSDDARYKFLSLYYYGRVLFNRGEYTDAIVTYTQAESLLKEVNDDYLAGLLYTQFGEIYRIFYDYNKSLEAFEMACDHYSSAGREYHRVHALHDIGVAYGNLDEFERAIHYFNVALELAVELEDADLEMICYQNLIMLYDIMYEYEKCGEIVDVLTNRFDEELYSPKCLGSFASYYAQSNSNRRAEEYLQRAWERTANVGDSIDMSFKTANTMKLMGRNDESMHYFEMGIQLQNRELHCALQQPIVSAQKDYFQNQAEFNAYRLEKNRQIYITLSIIIVLVMVVVTMYIRHKIAAKNSEINRYMEAMQDLEQSLFTRDMAANSMTEQINHLFESQFSLIDKLSNTYYETHGTKRDKEAIYTQVRSEIEKLQTNKRYIQQLEDIVNKHKSDVMRVLRESMPDFSEMDYRLLCFLYAGFSAKAISVFTGDSIGNIYMRKSRLKSKISQSNTENRDIILRYL